MARNKRGGRCGCLFALDTVMVMVGNEIVSVREFIEEAGRAEKKEEEFPHEFLVHGIVAGPGLMAVRLDEVKNMVFLLRPSLRFGLLGEGETWVEYFSGGW
jgi:hypothetical protein